MLTLLNLLTSPANAFVIIGNPTLTLKIERAEGDLTNGSAVLEGIRVHRCDGNYDDFYADATVDPVQGWSTYVGEFDICMVEVFWAGDTMIESNTFELKSAVTSHNVKITGLDNATDWNPFLVSTGSFNGSEPEVVISFD